MSVKTLNRRNDTEKAVYLIGLAASRQLKHAPRDPATRKEIAAVASWIEHWLDDKQLTRVMTATAWVFDSAVCVELNPENIQLSPAPPKDDIPF